MRISHAARQKLMQRAVQASRRRYYELLSTAVVTGAPPDATSPCLPSEKDRYSAGMALSSGTTPLRTSIRVSSISRRAARAHS